MYNTGRCIKFSCDTVKERSGEGETLCLGGAGWWGYQFHNVRGNAGIVFNGVINLADVVKRRKLQVHRFLLCRIKAFFFLTQTLTD